MDKSEKKAIEPKIKLTYTTVVNDVVVAVEAENAQQAIEIINKKTK